MFRKKLSYSKVFLALMGFLVVVGGCLGKETGVVDKIVDGCGPGPSYLTYEIVNNSEQTIICAIQGGSYDPNESSPPDHSKEPPIPPDYPTRAFIHPGGVRRGWLVDETFIMYSWRTDSKISIVPANLIAIRLDQNTVAYYTGYPRSLSDELNSWLMANQSDLASSFYNPKPTVDNMEAYGLFYIVRNAGRARLHLPTAESNHCDVYTSLDPLNRPHGLGFKLIFTVDGPKKSDIHISYQGAPRK